MFNLPTKPKLSWVCDFLCAVFQDEVQFCLHEMSESNRASVLIFGDQGTS